MAARVDLRAAVCGEVMKNVRHVSKHVQLIHVNLRKIPGKKMILIVIL